MRKLALFLLLAVGLGCSPAPAPDRTATSIDGRRTTRDTSSTDPEPEVVVVAGEPDPEPVTIAGLLVNDRGEAIVGRRFVSVGGDRDQRTGQTGPGGTIAIEGVVPPYDLLVEGSGGDGPVLFFGMTRTDPTVELGERAASVAPAQTIRIGVLAPPCGEEHCIVDVVTASPSGEGSASVISEPNADGDAVALVDVDHVWRTTRPVDGEQIELHVLVRDAKSERFSYARHDPIAPSAGATVDEGVLHARAVPASALLQPGGVTDGFANGTSWTTAVTLDVGAASFFLASAHGASLFTRVPLLDDAAWRVVVSAAADERIRIAWSGAHDVREPTAPRLVLPPAVSDVVVADGRLRWQGGGANALATIDVLDVARATLRYRIVTNMSDFPLAKLEYLGLRGLEKGPHELVLTVSPDVSLNAAVDPDPVVRARQRDTRHAGQVAYARVAFDVTP